MHHVPRTKTHANTSTQRTQKLSTDDQTILTREAGLATAVVVGRAILNCQIVGVILYVML